MKPEEIIAEVLDVYVGNTDNHELAKLIVEKLGLTLEYSEGDEWSRMHWYTPDEAPEYIEPQDIETRYITAWTPLHPSGSPTDS